ncbi:hypothetical protein BHE74_00001652, partial [Ensete ventricosum]
MGNRISGSRRRPVEEHLTRPQRILRQPTDVDYKKLRKLILARKLAPCFDPLDELPHHPRDLEECPICFFVIPSLLPSHQNRVFFCSNSLCFMFATASDEKVRSFLPSDILIDKRCPFCKTSCYAVEYRGARTEEEKDLERA